VLPSHVRSAQQVTELARPIFDRIVKYATNAMPFGPNCATKAVPIGDANAPPMLGYRGPR
ncbi:MAG: hypothetical protein ACREPE_09670, partial [Lysobacter sp.]